VQVDPIKPIMKGSGAKRLNLESDELLSNFACKVNLRHYILVGLARLALALEYMHHNQLLHRDIKVGAAAACEHRLGSACIMQ
jgi:serine/threonine protein kinase